MQLSRATIVKHISLKLIDSSPVSDQKKKDQHVYYTEDLSQPDAHRSISYSSYSSALLHMTYRHLASSLFYNISIEVTYHILVSYCATSHQQVTI